MSVQRDFTISFQHCRLTNHRQHMARCKSAMGTRAEIKMKAEDHDYKMRVQNDNLEAIKRERGEKIEAIRKRRALAKARAEVNMKYFSKL